MLSSAFCCHVPSVGVSFKYTEVLFHIYRFGLVLIQSLHSQKSELCFSFNH